MSKQEKLPVYILAGGKSSRFGSNKARATVAGGPLIMQVRSSLEPFASSIIVVAEADGAYEDLGLKTIGDLKPGLGPLGGLQAAISDMTGEGWFLLSQCDRLGIRPEWVRRLIDGRRAAGEGCRAVVFRGRYYQPIPGLYHSSLQSAVDDLIAMGELKLSSLLDPAFTHALELPENWARSKDINTKNDLKDYDGN